MSVFGHFSLSRSGDFLLALTVFPAIYPSDPNCPDRKNKIDAYKQPDDFTISKSDYLNNNGQVIYPARDYDLLITIKNAEEKKILKYLSSKKSNELKEEIINY